MNEPLVPMVRDDSLRTEEEVWPMQLESNRSAIPGSYPYGVVWPMLNSRSLSPLTSPVRPCDEYYQSRP